MSLEQTDKTSIGSRFRDWPFIAICAVILAGMTQPWEVIQPRDTVVLLVSVGAVFLLLWWSDKYEREPIRTVLWAFLWGAFPACLLSYYLEGALTTISGGVLIEEGMKLIALILIIRRGSVQSWTDGLVMGGYVGLGFAAMEDLVYAINGNNSFNVLVVRGVFSIFAHTFFSGLGAVVIVMGYLKKQWWLSGIGFLIACFLHLTWNTVLAWEIFANSALGFLFFFSIVPPSTLFITSILLRKHERHELLVQGKYAIENGYLTEDQLWFVVSFKARRSASKLLDRAARKAFHAELYDHARQLLSGKFERPSAPESHLEIENL